MSYWIRTSEQQPPDMQNVIVWSEGYQGFGHAYREGDQWYYGCECFSDRGAPDFWMLPTPPEQDSATEKP